MSNPSDTRTLAEIISANMTVGEMWEARQIYNTVREIEREEAIATGLLYQLGIAEGKRQDRARRKGGAA